MDGSYASDGDPAYPAELVKVEDALVRARREAVRKKEAAPTLDPPQNELSAKVDAMEGRIGIGLSGGGIRSATFCLGVFQALAKARGGTRPGLIGQLDYLSTVSGGGYFGAFLGRLFTRSWITAPADVERVLLGQEQPEQGRHAFRFLRDNGRYLAPRGSGDLLMMLAVALRNWVSVQVVLFTLVLTIFVGLQLVALARPELIERARDAVAMVIGERVPIWWSWWFIALVPVIVLWAAPACWAYWVIPQPHTGRGNLLRRSDLLVLLACTLALFVVRVSADARPFVALVAVIAIATTIMSIVANRRAVLQAFRGGGDGEAAIGNASRARNRVSTWLKYALIAASVVIIVAFIDSFGATAHLFASRGQLYGWIAGLLASFAGAAAFGRQLLVLFGDRSRDARPLVRWSVLSWIVAVLMLGFWLISANAVSHYIAWRLGPPFDSPESLTRTPTTRLQDAVAVVIEGGAERQVVRAEPATVPVPAEAAVKPSDEERLRFATVAFVLLFGLTLVFGYSPVFLNLSTLHAFYAQRLTRAYLGATNERRRTNGYVTEVVTGDDVPADEYWQWPGRGERAGDHMWRRVVRRARSLWGAVSHERASASAIAAIDKGGPLHLVNVTVNETLDARTGVQQQDRKGIGLAIGPAGFSLGVRHHLVANPTQGFVAPRAEGHPVFDHFVASPEVLTLGRWVSISGAAFTAAAGARTSVPMAILATLANVRLGYWWDSGLKRPVSTKLLPPVYRGLLAEGIARLRGTGDRLWNVSDGGHFENLAGYELIRRKLPLIVLVDAEADPDFTFEGLANLVRKARLDFNAEVDFLDNTRLEIPEAVRPLFGSLDMLRRGRWSDEPVEDPHGAPVSGFATSRPRLSMETNRALYSRAHAAIARVTHRDGSTSWLVYLKASLTGDEPADVIQYHREHNDFPQETTADQFFDEAQWESYRRLGEHIGANVLTPAVFALAREGAPRVGAPR